MQEILLKMIFFESRLSKSLKKINFTFFFWTQSLLMDKVTQTKRGLEPVISCSSGFKTSSGYILSEQVWWCTIKQFLSYSKNYINKFMQPNPWHHKLFNFHLFSWIWKVWKKREKFKQIEYLENEKSFLDEIKKTFHSFWTTIIWCKNKNLMKNSRCKLEKVEKISLKKTYYTKQCKP